MLILEGKILLSKHPVSYGLKYSTEWHVLTIQTSKRKAPERTDNVKKLKHSYHSTFINGKTASSSSSVNSKLRDYLQGI